MSVATLPRPDTDGGHRRKWTREEFQRASTLGLFRPDERLELLQGEIYEKMPPNPPHASLTDIIAETLRRIAAEGACVRVEKPIVLGSFGQPEPDVAVVRGTLRDYLMRHPTADDTLLVVEVSNTTLAHDQGTKAAEYAAAGIVEYWIINLNHRCVEVYRDPQNGEWQHITTHDDTGTLSPLFAPQSTISIRGMLP